VGSKLSVLAALIALGGLAHAGPADDAMKKGIELYKAGKYAEAIPYLDKANKLDPKPDTLFALAQAQRLSGDCATAAANYHKVIEQVSDMQVGKLVQQNLALCEPDQPKKAEPAKEPAHDDKPVVDAQPQVVEKTVVHEVDHTDKLAAVMLGGGMLALGAAGGLYVAASSNSDAADLAKSLPDHDSLADKAKSERTMMYVASGVGAVMIGVAIYRWTTGGSSKPNADVAVVPGAGGGSVYVMSRF
jgi:tetratricopeptide (TPR) repeat protein